MTDGNADGLGSIREKELEKSTQYLGFKHFKIPHDTQICDGMGLKWDKALVAEHIYKYIEEHNINSVPYMYIYIYI